MQNSEYHLASSCQHILVFAFELSSSSHLEHKDECCGTEFILLGCTKKTHCLIDKLKCEEVRVHLEECWESFLITS